MYAWHIDPSILALFFTVLLNPSISHLNRYIHLYWTGPHTHASYTKCTGKCSIELEKSRGKILSNLQRIMGMFFFITTQLSILRVDEHKSLKYSLNSVNGLQIWSSSFLNVIGSKHSINTWHRDFSYQKLPFVQYSHTYLSLRHNHQAYLTLAPTYIHLISVQRSTYN